MADLVITNATISCAYVEIENSKEAKVIKEQIAKILHCPVSKVLFTISDKDAVKK
jgi:hypothetical protein